MGEGGADLERHPEKDVWEMYVDALCAAAQSGIYDSMAHPDLVKVFGNRPSQAMPNERISTASRAAGVCAEVSTGGFGGALNEIYPDPSCSPCSASAARGLRWSRRPGPGEVGGLFDQALAVLRDTGYSSITRFDRARADAGGDPVTRHHRRVGAGFDAHAFGDGRRLVLAGVEIEHGVLTTLDARQHQPAAVAERMGVEPGADPQVVGHGISTCVRSRRSKRVIEL